MARKKQTMDGNTAAAHVCYALSEVAAIYPITPSSVMAEKVDLWASQGRTNLFGQTVEVTEMQSEAGAAGAVHGSLSAGALTSTFTSSQGLLLMIPNLYKMAGEMLPGVIHVAARCVATHAINIYGDHSDVMACRQTGCALLCSNNPQEVMDLGAAAHLAALEGSLPVLHFFDGFRTSHEQQKIEVWDDAQLDQLLDRSAVDRFRRRALNPEHPTLRGSCQGTDLFFQNREAVNPAYQAFPDTMEQVLQRINQQLGTRYALYEYYGSPEAEHVVVAMGSVCGCIQEVVDYLNQNGGKVGLIQVRLYRPFDPRRFAAALPESCRVVTVLDRTKEPGAPGEPLYLDTVAALHECGRDNVQVLGGRYGLGGKDTPPAAIFSVFDNMQKEKKTPFTIGIDDDVTRLSLPARTDTPMVSPAGTTACKFWGLGADGTVSANKNSIAIIGAHTPLYTQAYFAYDSKKSGGVTVSHLRFGQQPIRSSYLVHRADLVACHNPSYVGRFAMVEDLLPGGAFLLNCGWDLAELEKRLTAEDKRYLADNQIRLYFINATAIADELGLGGRVNTILQAAFFRITGLIDPEEARQAMKEAIVRSYGHKGENIVQMNQQAVDRGMDEVRQISVPDYWSKTPDDLPAPPPETPRPELTEFLKNVLIPANAQRGDRLPVSVFSDRADGTLPPGTAAYERRGIAVRVPRWLPANCIQCNRCALFCPHGVIRPFVLTEQQRGQAPQELPSLPLLSKDPQGRSFTIAVSVSDCTGCGSCVEVCPGRQGAKALMMETYQQQPQQKMYDYLRQHADQRPLDDYAVSTPKGSQFAQPLLEFSGACAGCGETPYAKLLTQLYGERLMIANATGCSSIWGGSAPSTPYTVTAQGKGPSWGNSLFEDNAEYGYGMALAVRQVRQGLRRAAERLMAAKETGDEVRTAAQTWLEHSEKGEGALARAQALTDAIASSGCRSEECRQILNQADFLAKKSVWLLGGDGWAYDIGYGGVDQVLSTLEDVNLLVFDTEVYSNTGGQASKATPLGAVAPFAAAGKRTASKSLAEMALHYEHVYVAQVALGADPAQAVRAITEAERHPGPSLVVCYCQCISHGIEAGMGASPAHVAWAVRCGYFPLFRRDPQKGTLTLDSREPDGTYTEFLQSQVRYRSLLRRDPARAGQLFQQAEEYAQRRYRRLQQLAQGDGAIKN